MKSAKENLTRSSNESKFTNSAASEVEGNAISARQSGWRRLIAAVAFVCLALAMSAHAQTFTTLATFNGTDGLNPVAPLVQGADGNFYGTSETGGAKSGNCCGTVFKITPDGALTTLHSFCVTDCTDGIYPTGGLILGFDGNFYGTTIQGGVGGCCGTVFKITPDGTLTTLHTFSSCHYMNCPDGAKPFYGLVQGSDGNFYGTTLGGGSYTVCSSGCGTVFKITPGGKLTTLHRFCSQTNCTDGSGAGGPLVQGFDGNFYETTSSGGSTSLGCCGTIFRITPSGTLTTLHSFAGPPTDGTGPEGGLAQGADGALYGTTVIGGRVNLGTVFKIGPLSGGVTILHNFGGPRTEGANPMGGLVQATDGNFYGTTMKGGPLGCSSKGCGTIFEITPGRTETILHTFSSDTNGIYPEAGLIQGTDGNFYGTTGQTSNSLTSPGPGTVFRLAMGLAPFVEPRPAFGKVGANVVILGNNLTGSTAVSFAGTPANFTVVSDTEITASVPAGATTGKLQVTTSSGALASNVAFRVMPQITGFSPASGGVGTSMVIKGESLTGATAVTFGGARASNFTVDSDTQITAAVPTGAVTGRIATQTPGGHVQSLTNFTVTP